eukprot:409082-Hanusia_phi.AAC.3
MISWLAASPQHGNFRLMMQVGSAIAGLAADNAKDAQLMIEEGLMPVLIKMMHLSLRIERLGTPNPSHSHFSLSASWRECSATAAAAALAALIQNRSTAEAVVKAGGLSPMIKLCRVANTEVQLRHATSAMREFCDTDEKRDLLLNEGGLESMLQALEKCDMLKMDERGEIMIRMNILSCLQSMSLSSTVRGQIWDSGIMRKIIGLSGQVELGKRSSNAITACTIAIISNCAFTPQNRRQIFDLGVVKFLTRIVEANKNSLVVFHACIAIRNLALRKATSDFKTWLSDDDDFAQSDFGDSNCLKHLMVLLKQFSPPNNDDIVLEQLLNALIVLVWNNSKNRSRMANKEVIDLQHLTRLAAGGSRVNTYVRQRLAILIADLAQVPSIQAYFAECGLLEHVFQWLFLPRTEAVTRYCAAGAIMNMVANEAVSSRFGKALFAETKKSFLSSLAPLNDGNRAKVWQTGAVTRLIEILRDTEMKQEAISFGVKRSDIMICALLQNVTASVTLRRQVADSGGLQLLLNIAKKGRDMNMIRYALGALRNIALEPGLQQILIETGFLDVCQVVSTEYSDKAGFDNGGSPQEYAAAVLRNLTRSFQT